MPSAHGSYIALLAWLICDIRVLIALVVTNEQ